MVNKPVASLALLWLCVTLTIAPASAAPAGATTLDTLILDIDGDGRLEEVQPGEPYKVREDLGWPAQEGRDQRRRSLLFLAQLSDVHIVDEESPMRGEFLDPCGASLTSAFRPQETLSTQVLNAMVRRLNEIGVSPVTGAPLELTIQTGDTVDNSQYNELRWFVDTLDGGTVAPNSGAVSYDGVQTRSPDPTYPNLLQDANQPFTAAGLRMPWYSVFGNHDQEMQGTFPIEARWQLIALGSRKIYGLDAIEQLCGPPDFSPDHWRALQLQGQRDADVRTAPPDRNRLLVPRRAYMRAHFVTRGAPIGHGFSWADMLQDKSYYSFAPSGGLQFIVLDSVNEVGGADGGIDARQFAWLEEQLIARSSRYYDASGSLITTDNRDSLLVIFSHHSDPALLPDVGPAPAGADPGAPGSELEALLHRFPNVILHVAGHTHEHKISPRPDPAGRTQGYWETVTSAHADWPQQGRLLEIADNADGSLSIYSTIVDHSAPADPAQAVDPSPGDGVNELQLAAISRQAAFQDPQRDPEARGTLLDRNVELLIPDPRVHAARPIAEG